jgi:pimeloyl-ACP methyl ester carboxylesterase
MNLPQFDTHVVIASDGTRLEAQSFGDGPLTVVIANGLGGTLVAWAPMLRALEHRARFVSWDYRGLYGSAKPRDLRRLRVEHHVDDLRMVMDALDVGEAVFAGWSMGVQVAVQSAADLGARCRGLLLINGTYGRVFETAFAAPGSRLVLPQINRLARRLAPVLPKAVSTVTRQPWLVPALARAGIVDERLDREVFLAIAHGFDRLDFDVYHRIMGYLHEHDGEPALARIHQPLMLIAGGKDAMTPPSVRDVFHARVPHAETHIIPAGTHYTLLEYPDDVLDHVDAFLGRHFEGQAHAVRAPAAVRSR